MARHVSKYRSPRTFLAERVQGETCRRSETRSPGYKSLQCQELAVVQKEIDKFLKDSEKEALRALTRFEASQVCLSAAFDAHQRKYAHSLAERHNLVHSTRQNESGHTCPVKR